MNGRNAVLPRTFRSVGGSEMDKKHQVLVVDDSDISRKELRHLVRREGLEALQLHEAESGRLASAL